MKSDDFIKIHIGEKIRARRQAKKMTQSALAQSIEMDEKQLSRLEAGKHYPTLKTLVAIIYGLEMKFADFDIIADKQQPSEFYKIIEILKASDEQEMKMFLSVIKAIKNPAA